MHSLIQKRTGYRILLVMITIMFQFSYAFEFTSLVITTNTSIINTLATYTIFYDREFDRSFSPIDVTAHPLDPSDTMTVTFPIEYDLSATSGLITCTIVLNSGTINQRTCTLTPGTNQLIIEGAFTDQSIVYNATLTVSNINNPSPAIQTSQFIGTIGSDTSATGGDNFIILDTASFQSCSITFDPTTVNSDSAMILTITPTNSIPQDGQIVIQLPDNRWANDISTTSILPISNIMSCTQISANVQSTISCAGNINFLTITVSDLFSAGGNSAQFQFKVNDFLSPPTNQPSDPIIIKSQEPSGQIDQCVAYITGLTPKNIDQFEVTDTSGLQLIVNRVYTIKFSFTLVDDIIGSDYITIQFPSDSDMVYNGAVNGIPRYNQTNSTYSDSSKIMTIYLRDPTRQTNLGTEAYVNIGDFTAPPSILPTGDFIISIMRNGYPLMSGTTQLIAGASTLSGSVTVGDSKVNQQTSYTFSLTTLDPLTSSGQIKIVLPDTVDIVTTSSSCASVTGDRLSTNPTCIISQAERSIILTNINSTGNNILAQTFTITINGLENPPSTKTSDDFIIQLYYTDDDGSLVAQGSISGVTATTAIIDASQVTITPAQYIVNEDSVTYTLQLDVVHPIPVGGYFQIYVPSQIQMDEASIGGLCSINIRGSSYQTTSCTASVHDAAFSMIKFTNPFSTAINQGDFFIARIQNYFKNPPSTAPTTSFQIKTFWSDGESIAQITQALTIKMNTADSFNDLQIGRNSDKNFQITDYTFIITQESALQAESRLLITFPNNVDPVSGFTCSIISPVSQTLTCTQSSSQIRIILPNSEIASNTQIQLTITNIRNPPSFESAGTFSFQTKTSNNLYFYSAGSFTDTDLRNTIPTQFQNIQYTFTPAIYGTQVKLQITFNPSNSGVTPNYLRLNLANSFTVSSISCNAFDDIINGQCTSISTHTIEVRGTFVASQMNFSIQGFVSPNSAASDYTALVSFDQNDNKLDQSANDIIFQITCALPCRTCQESSPASCLSCYDQVAITPNVYYDSDQKNCYDNCLDGKYQNDNINQCTQCSSNCLTCETTATFCTSCKTDTQFKYLRIDSVTQQICVSQCPLGFYPDVSVDPSICTACVSPCVNCIDDLQCQSCISGRFLLGTDCLEDCTVGLFIQNSATNQCDPCHSSCKTCEAVVTNCTSCQSPLILYQNQCLDQCPSPLVPKSGTCGSCDSPCKTCSLTPTNCTSCISTSGLPYYLQFSCFTECPQNYYENIGTGSCSLCSQVADLNCENCSTASTCLTCDTGYVLYQSKCLDYTPSGYVNISGIAEACQGDCQTCQDTTNKCTSCKTKYLLNNNCLDQCQTGYVGINKICQACASPCRTCQTTVTNCLSCLTTLDPPQYYINNQCLQQCPDGTYQDLITRTCKNCISPCQYCSTLANCQTCLNGFYLKGTDCQQDCDQGFVGINRVCTQCQGNCATCQNSTQLCTSCQANTYLFQLNSSCLVSCEDGLFEDQLERKCVYCTQPCNTCQTTPTTCTSCLTGILYNSQCQNQCPDAYFNQSGTCTSCPTKCASCASLTKCFTCTDSYVLYNDFCISECPSTHAVVLSRICTKCSDSFCKQCTSADVCTLCQSDYSLLTGTCLQECPVLYETNGTHCIQINQQILTSDTSSFPVPFTIASIVFIIACLMSKLQFSHTYLPGAIYSLLSILEWGALVYFLYLYFTQKFAQQSMPLFVGLGALGYLYFLNFVAMIAQNIVVCRDKLFFQWNQGANKCSSIVSNIISLLINHKFRNILFCKLFTFSMFSAYLENISKFRVFNILSFLSLVHSGAAIFAASIALTYVEASTQLYYQCIDVIVVTAINIFMAFFNVMKSSDFFYQRTPDGFDLNKKIKAEDDLIQKNIYPTGNDQQSEIGQFSNFMHFGSSNIKSDRNGLASTQPLKFANSKNKNDSYQIEEENQYSYGSLIENSQKMVNKNYKGQQQLQEQEQQIKEFNEVSIQAMQIIDDQFDDTKPAIDFTTIQNNQQRHNDSQYTIFFHRSDKNIQNTIQKTEYSEIGIQNTLGRQPDMSNKSIQRSVRNPVDQSVQKYQNHDNVDRSIQHTVYFQDDSVQYGSSMKTKKPSMKNQSIQEQQQPKSVHNKSIMHQPSMHDQSGQRSLTSKHSQGIQGSLNQQQKSLQAAPSMHNQSNQNTYSINDQSQQITQKSYKNESIQNRATISNKSIQMGNQVAYDEFNQQISPQKSSNVIFQQEEQQNENKQIKKGLQQQQKDEFILPGKNIKSYEQQLEQRIRDRERQLQKLKRKVEHKERNMQQRQNAMKKNKGSFVVEAGKLYNKGQKQSSQNQTNRQVGENSELKQQPKLNTGIIIDKDKSLRRNNNAQPLKKQQKLVQEQDSLGVQKTLQEISVVDDEGHKHHIKAQFNNNNQQSQLMQVDNNYEGEILYEGSDDEDQNKNNQQQQQIKNNRQINKRLNKQKYQREQINDNLQQNQRYDKVIRLSQVQNSNQSMKKKQKSLKQINRKNNRQSQAQINSYVQPQGKDGASTNLNSSRMPSPLRNRQKSLGRNRPPIDVKHMDKSLYEGQSSDIASNIFNPPHNIRSDMSGTIQQIYPNLNKTVDHHKSKQKPTHKINNYNYQPPSQKNLQNNKLQKQKSRASQQKINQKIKQMLPHSNSKSRNQLPKQKQSDNFHIPSQKFTYNNLEATSPNKINSPNKMPSKPTHERKSSLLMAGRSQFTNNDDRLAYKKTNKGSPLKVKNKWEFQREDKNLSDSAEDQVKNTRTKYNVLQSRLMAPFETDKEETSFRNVSFLGSEKIIDYEKEQKKISPSKTQRNPLIHQMQTQRIPVKPQVQLERAYGTDVYDEDEESEQHQPYIEDDSDNSDIASRHKNNMLLNAMLQRPDNSDIKSYYNNHGTNNSRSKDKKRKSSTKYSNQTSKIYMQRFQKPRK